MSRSSKTFRSDDPASILSNIGTALIIIFAILQVFAALPVQLLNPEWMLKITESLRSGGTLPLFGAAMILIAQQLNPDSTPLAARLKLIKKYSTFAALGFLLIIPIQVYAGYKQIRGSELDATQNVMQLRKNVQIIENATSKEDLVNAYKQLPGIPRNQNVIVDIPVPLAKQKLVDQINPQIKRAETMIQERKANQFKQAIQKWIRDGMIAGVYAWAYRLLGRRKISTESISHDFDHLGIAHDDLMGSDKPQA